MYYYGRGLPQNYTEALQSFARAAKAGNSDGMYNAGLMHKEGRGTAANVTEVRLDGPGSTVHSCIPAGMHGPTCIFWANLTTFSLEAEGYFKQAAKHGQHSPGR
jgi:TPR repeat protein